MIAYVSQVFPSLTTTFVYREIVALQQQGVSVTPLSIWRAPSESIPPETREVAAETVSLFPAPWSRVLSGHVSLAVAHPLRYLRLAAFLATRRDEEWANRYKAWLSAYVAQEIIRRGAKHIHAHFASSPASVAMAAARLAGVSFSFTAHAIDIFAHRIMLAEKLREARFVIAISEYNKRVMSELVPEASSKIHVVHCGVDPRVFAPDESRTESTPPLVLAVGQMREKKGLKYLVEACSLLAERGIDLKCVIVGGGEGLDDLKAQAAASGLNGRMVLTGPLYQSEVRAHLRAADVFVLPCVVAADGDQDGIPVSLMEAMAGGVPVVSTFVSGIPELVTDGHDGLLVPPRDAPALARALERLIADPGLRRQMGAHARAKVLAQFDLDRNVQSLIQIFQDYGVLS